MVVKIENKYKYLKVFLALLFLGSAIFCNCGVYANSLTKIKYISFFSRKDPDNIKIIEYKGGEYEVRASFERNNETPRLTFKLIDSEDNECPLNVKTGDQVLNIAEIDVGEFMPSYVVGSLPEGESAGVYKEYCVEELNKEGGVIETLRGSMPELKVSLEDSKHDGIYDDLKIENIYSEEIKIAGIKSGKQINVLTDMDKEITIPAGGYYVVKIEPKECVEVNIGFTDNITIEYEADNEKLIGEIGIKSFCGEECVCPEKEECVCPEKEECVCPEKEECVCPEKEECVCPEKEECVCPEKEECVCPEKEECVCPEKKCVCPEKEECVCPEKEECICPEKEECVYPETITCLNPENLSDLQLKLLPGFIHKMYANDSQSIEYLIVNKSDYEIDISVSELEPPIYRDMAARLSRGYLDCGNSLVIKQACVVKFLVYPTKTGEIRQKLKVSSKKLDRNLFEDIIVQIGDDVYSLPLQVTPIAEDESIGSIYNIVCQDSNDLVNVPDGYSCDKFPLLCKDGKTAGEATAADPRKNSTQQPEISNATNESFGLNSSSNQQRQLKYRLRNNSDKKLEIISIRVPTGVSDHDFAFVVKKECAILEPGAECELLIYYNSNRHGDVSRSLEVGFKECTGFDYWPTCSKGKKVSVPILISKQ